MIDIGTDFWDNVETLRRLSNVLQWLAITLIFLGGFISVAKYLVDRREKAIAKLEQPVVSGSGVIEIRVAWDALGNSNTWKSIETGNRGYIVFGKGNDAFLVMRSTEIVAEAEDKKGVAVKIILDLNSPESEVRKPITLLRSAEFVQVRNPAVPENSQILGGSINCVFNGNTRVLIAIPPQQMEKDLVFVRNLQQVISVSPPAQN